MELRKDAMTAPASPASTASLPSEHGSESEVNSPEQPRKRPKTSKRRLRRVAKAKTRNDGERSARALGDTFRYQQRQNRAWLHHQVQLPERGGVGREVEGELRGLFGKDIEAHPATNLPLLKSGMTLSSEAEATYQRLLGERAEMVGQALKPMAPHWWDASEIVPRGKKSRGEKRAAKRERERLEGVVGGVGELSIGEKEVGEEMEIEGEDGKKTEVEGEDGGILTEK